MKIKFLLSLLFFPVLANATPQKDVSTLPQRELTEAFAKTSRFNRDEKKHQFQTMDIDTRSNHQAAKRILSKSYSIPLSEEQVRSKVLAIQFLRWTKHWGGVQECISALNQVIRHTDDRNQFQNRQIKLNLLSDVGDLAGICMDLDSIEFRKYLDAMPSGLLKNETALGARIMKSETKTQSLNRISG